MAQYREQQQQHRTRQSHIEDTIAAKQTELTGLAGHMRNLDDNLRFREARRRVTELEAQAAQRQRDLQAVPGLAAARAGREGHRLRLEELMTQRAGSGRR